MESQGKAHGMDVVCAGMAQPPASAWSNRPKLCTTHSRPVGESQGKCCVWEVPVCRAIRQYSSSSSNMSSSITNTAPESVLINDVPLVFQGLSCKAVNRGMVWCDV